MTTLRRWPDELRPITNTELADQLGISQSSLSTVLQNGPRWKATPMLLEHVVLCERRITEIVRQVSIPANGGPSAS